MEKFVNPVCQENGCKPRILLALLLNQYKLTELTD